MKIQFASCEAGADILVLYMFHISKRYKTIVEPG
jgi:hypothetical protein